MMCISDWGGRLVWLLCPPHLPTSPPPQLGEQTPHYTCTLQYPVPCYALNSTSSTTHSVKSAQRILIVAAHRRVVWKGLVCLVCQQYLLAITLFHCMSPSFLSGQCGLVLSTRGAIVQRGKAVVSGFLHLVQTSGSLSDFKKKLSSILRK